MSNRSLAGRVSAFAHLVGARRTKAVEEEARPAENTTTDGAPATTEEVEEVQDEVDETKEKVDELEERVEALEGGETTEDTDAEPEEPAAKKAWQAGRRAGAKAERARGAAIFGAQEAAANPALAASLAFESDVPVKQALALLRAGAAGTTGSRKGGLDQRMQRQPQPPLAGGAQGASAAPEGSPQAIIDRITAAGRAVGVVPAKR
ncbi:hypothetical protein [Roseomonas xinghualingensis]|uniref:hypothetical protein n=1 Tax=Roseomonas xinghualingensis TaxID=2986475 RepID=UPI0021F1A679|nr:hypothetical protein [Roseomonas sp. SXEYE001]MCV4207563.1 hypothetical protein [Roseomonas sp. SXEYE001]